MQEIDLVPLARNGRVQRVIVDSREACIAEAGEVQRLFAAMQISKAKEESWLPELGQLVSDDGLPADQVDEDLTIL